MHPRCAVAWAPRIGGQCAAAGASSGGQGQGPLAPAAGTVGDSPRSPAPLPQGVAIKQLRAGQQASVLPQLQALEKRLFKRSENWAGGAPCSRWGGWGGSGRKGARWPAGARATAVALLRADQLGKEAQRRNALLLYAEAAAGHVVGYLLCSTARLNFHIARLAVAADAQRRGIGRALVQAAVAAGRERHALSVTLHVDPGARAPRCAACMPCARGQRPRSPALSSLPVPHRQRPGGQPVLQGGV